MIRPSWDELRERSRRFWTRESTDRPLVGCLYNRTAPLREFERQYGQGAVNPAALTRERFIAECERRHAASLEIGGDAVFVAYPYIGIPWMEGILGCTVRCGGGSAWPERLAIDWRELTLDSIDWDNGWFRTLQEETTTAMDISEGRFPVGPTHLRGNGDLIASLMGQAEFCLALYDYPQEIRRLIEVYVAVWRRIVDAQYELLREDHGGYWNGNQPVWAPGKTMFIPADVASLISPSMFKDFFLEPTQRMLDGINYCIMHTHSGYLEAYPLDVLMDIHQLKAIQIGIDPNGPSVKELLPWFRQVLERKALIIAGGGMLTADDVQMLLRELPPEGLYVLGYKESIQEAKDLLAGVG